MSAVSRCQHLDKYEVKLRLIYQRPTFVLFPFPTFFSKGRSIKDFFFIAPFHQGSAGEVRHHGHTLCSALLCSAWRQASFSLFVFSPRAATQNGLLPAKLQEHFCKYLPQTSYF